MKHIIPLILVLIILAVGVSFLMSTERQESSNMQEVYRQTEPLQRQKDELLLEKQKLVEQKIELEESFQIETRDVSTLQILFRECNVKLFTHVYPLMRERGITGVIGISNEDFPGINLRDKMTAEQYNRLIMDGWGSCLIYDGGFLLENYIRTVKDILAYQKIELPASIYFTEKYNTYDAETMDPILLKYGINTVIRNAVDGRSETVSEVGEIWHTGAMPWNYTGANTDLEQLAAIDGGNLCLTASFDDIWDGLLTEKKLQTNGRYTDPEVQEAFIAFLDLIEVTLGHESSLLEATPTPTPTPLPGTVIEETPNLLLRSTSFEDAREAHLVAQTTQDNQLAVYESMQSDLDNQISTIDAQIADLEAQIADIYTAFNIKKANLNKDPSGETA